MPPQDEINIFVPSGMIPFQCDLSGRCCGGWEIGMDQCSYDRLKSAMTEKNQGELFDANIVVSDNKEDETKYFAVINLSSGRCGLLEDGGLCSIHKNYGFETLPDICKTFPRLVYATPFGKELSVTFACPSAAKLLANKDKIRKVKNPENYQLSNGTQYFGLITREIFDRTDIKKFYFELEDQFIRIIQHDKFPLDTRLVLMGLTIKRLMKLKSPCHQDLLSVFQMNDHIMSQAYFKDEVKKISPNISQQLFLLKEFIKLRLESVPDKAIKDFLADAAKTFQFDLADEELNSCTERYIEYYQTYYSPVKEEVEYIFENYLVFFLYRKPFASHDLEKSYFLTIYFYSLIRLVSISLAHNQGVTVNGEIAIKAVWIIEKAIGHSHTFYLGVLDYLAENSYTSVSHAITLFLMPDNQNETVKLKSKTQLTT